MQTPDRVLVVDDTADSRQLTVLVLERAGFAVTESATGMEALQLASTTRPDVVVLDVHLPDIDGVEVCRRLKVEPGTRPIPVLFLSATATGLDAWLRGLGHGADAYLTTPCEPAELVSAVTSLVRLRNAEAALRMRDSLYQLLFERNLAGVFRSAWDGRLIECNEAFARLLGYRTPADTGRHNAWDFYADPTERDRILERLGSDRRVTNQEVRWRRAGGQDFPVIVNASRIGEGGDAYVEGIVLDLSDRMRAEEALRQRETQLRNLGDNLPDGVIYQVVRRLDGSNDFPYMSSGLEGRYGVRAAEAMADASVVYRLVVPEDLARIRAAADESIRTGEPIDVEYRIRTPSGELRWMNLRGRPSRLADGATQWDVVALDITDRKRADEALRAREGELRALAETLRRSEARYRLLFERSFVGIFRTRPDGILLECDPDATR